MTELVSRALYDAMVAERDALAARVTTAEAMVAAQADNRRMDAGRIEMLKAERDSLETRLAAAHGLQARAERAEAEARNLRGALRTLYDACEYWANSENDGDFGEIIGPSAEAADAILCPAAVPS